MVSSEKLGFFDVVRSVLNAQHRADEERILAVKREKIVQKTQVRFKSMRESFPQL